MLDLRKIHKGMDVMTSDGRKLGAVRDVMEHVLFMDDVDESAGGKSSVPMIWIIDIDDSVRLAKSLEQVQKEWQAGAASSL